MAAYALPSGAHTAAMAGIAGIGAAPCAAAANRRVFGSETVLATAVIAGGSCVAFAMAVIAALVFMACETNCWANAAFFAWPATMKIWAPMNGVAGFCP